MISPILGLAIAAGVGICFILIVVKITKMQFNILAKSKVALLRLDYYAQQNRTREKDESFEREVEKVEIKYGLKNRR